ncbi:hypothetical protein BX600DRAFT_513066 [Xylariales sp. PMI_506]|nr:hypothetical protein BX600DRAFT_513066 [Xylariales sp. PMI_506]
MAQPPYPYLPYSGQQTQQPNPYASVTSNQAATTTYHTIPDPNPSTAGNHVSAFASYEYNASRIPGLGMSMRSSAGTSPSHRADDPTAWSQSAFVGTSASIPSAQNKAQGIIGLRELPKPYRSENLRGHSLHPPRAPINNDNLEEGELSEGESEDIYQPGSSKDVNKDLTQPTQNRPAEDLTGSVGDADESSIYETGSAQENTAMASTSASLQAADEDEDYEPGEYEPEYQPRERSGSYSPYLSPSEVRPNPSAILSKPPEPFTGHLPSPAANGPYQQLSQNGSLPNNQALADGLITELKARSGDGDIVVATPHLYKSVTEAKKKAQEAILGLWPLKVRFKNYLEEGFDPQVVKTLFTDLGLDVASPKTAASPPEPSAGKKTTPSEPHPEVTKVVKATDSATQPPIAASQGSTDKPTTGSDTKVTDKKSAQEERKDKIARMLAEKSKKSASSVAAPAAASSTTTPKTTLTSAQADSAKAKTRAENNLKLQQKLAALRKAQEEAEARKKLKTAQEVNAVITTEVNTSSDTNPKHKPDRLQRPDQDSSSGEAGASLNAAGIPVLSVSTTPQPQRGRIGKRPVAADFDGYSSNGVALKRTRTQETLIIDVSDDEDVEMDLGSPTDGPTGPAINSTLGARSNALGTFPPLTNSHSWRGHVSAPGTPANGAHGQKLDFLTQQIEEAKRKIAEAEAKKSTKNPASSTQSPAATPIQITSSRLPKPSDVARSTRNDRRDRIASYDLPAVEATLKDKQARLNRLREEAARLELEVNTAMVERQKLAVEMETLEGNSTSDSESTRLNGQYITMAMSQGPEPIPAAMAEQDLSIRNDTPAALVLQPSESESQIVSKSPSEKSEMDIDSSDISGDDDSANAVRPHHISTPDNDDDEVRSSPSNGTGISQGGSLAAETAPFADHVSAQTSEDNNLVQRTAEISEVSIVDQELADADVPMQISDAEIETDEEDSYEPMPAQISATDKVPNVERRDTEVNLSPLCARAVLMHYQIPDEDPYEPSPAHLVADTVSGDGPGTSAGEVYIHSSLEPRLLTSKQAETKPHVPIQDLLSYQSPLKYFHAYRFHPKFLENVPGGLKSMTYSSRIDSNRPLCPSFMEGVECPNGPECQLQHFDKMVLSDTDIIAQLGSTDMYTGEQKIRFIDGLKRVLNDLKANKVKDFDRITKAIIQYRADFLQDTTKVLPLNVAI